MQVSVSMVYSYFNLLLTSILLTSECFISINLIDLSGLDLWNHWLTSQIYLIKSHQVTFRREKRKWHHTWDCALILAPSLTRTLTTSAWPAKDAMCRAVFPFCYREGKNKRHDPFFRSYFNQQFFITFIFSAWFYLTVPWYSINITRIGLGVAAMKISWMAVKQQHPSITFQGNYGMGLGHRTNF